MEAASITETASAPPPARSVGDVLNAYALPLLLFGALVAQFIYDPTGTLENVKTGLSNGMIWALIALGYTLVYGIVELINFAHGEVFMIGAFVSLSLWQTFGVTDETGIALIVVSIVVFLVLAMLASATLNVLIERAAYRPLRNAPKLAPLITAIGMSFILQNVGLLWRPTPDQVPDLIGSHEVYFTIFDVDILHSDVFAVIVTVPLLIALLWFVGSTKYGKAMRATAQDPDAARLMGIDVDRTISLTFLLGGMMAGAAGLIYALYNLTVRFNMGFTAGLIAFTAAVMGGIGNLKGAVVGGLIIGVIQSISDTHFGQVWTPAVVFAILILIMVFKP
ncbi:MAG TPA: branched-chain amino acid ABC transporter permease, partial [Baekduia sp.]|nr:branched-chain amino acid ABC transporter permease [Baekduia sp.]